MFYQRADSVEQSTEASAYSQLKSETSLIVNDRICGSPQLQHLEFAGDQTVSQ